MALHALALAALSLPSALAFVPLERDLRDFGVLGEQRQVPQRARRFEPGTQARLAKQQAWADFQQGVGLGWKARFDQRTGLPYSAWGPGIDLGLAGDADADSVYARVVEILRAHPAMLGVPVERLQLGRSGRVDRTDTWYLRLDQHHEGVPVYRASVEVRVRFGKLIMLGVRTYPDLPTLDTPQLSSETALEVAIELGPAPFEGHERGDARLVVLPTHAGSGLDFVLAWEVRSETHAPRAKWVSWVDANTGELLSVQDELLRSQRVVYATHDVRTITGDYETSPLQYVPVWSDDGTAAYTDAEGAVDLDGDGFTSELRGEYFTVTNNDGAEGELSFTGDAGTWTTEHADQSEIDSYVFLHHVRDWSLEFSPEHAINRYQLDSYVNVSEAVCNAWFDGNFNFGPEHGNYGCNSTARIADVNYHEWGHGYHYWGLESGYFDSTASEGIADSISTLQTGDSVIGPYFWIGYSQGIRDLSELHVYPDDVVNESHEDGLIFGGAFWDLQNILMEDFGEDEGWRIASQLLADAIPAGFTITSAYDEFLAVDDDDGDLSNGTPHYCQLVEAFTLHGIGPSSGTSLLTLDHEPLGNQAADGEDYAVAVSADTVTAECFEVDFESGRLWYSIDDGDSWDSVSLSTGDGTMSGAIPAQEPGTIVHYFVEVDSDDGGEVAVPEGREINPFSFAVGDLVELFAHDFDEDDAGFTHELVSGEVTEGADDWMWGSPLGMGGDPDQAFSGDKLWGNDLGGGNFNGQYQNDKTNQLSSSTIDVAPYNELLVQFQRWLQVEDGYYDQANVLVDGELAWTNHATDYEAGDEHHQDEQWSLASIMADDPELDGQVQVAWQIVSDAGLYMGGWNIDDFAVYAPPTPRNLMTVMDFSASEDEPGLVLSWTTPDYDDLVELQVVYRPDSWPTGHEDSAGTVVLHVDSPEPGLAVSHTLSDAPAGEGYYAVFAADSEGTWTRGGYDGYNADLGTPEAWDGDGDGSGVAGPACGCSASSGARAAAPWLFGLVGLVGLRRRRA